MSRENQHAAAFLISRGADVAALDTYGYTPLVGGPGPTNSTTCETGGGWRMLFIRLLSTSSSTFRVVMFFPLPEQHTEGLVLVLFLLRVELRLGHPRDDVCCHQFVRCMISQKQCVNLAFSVMLAAVKKRRKQTVFSLPRGQNGEQQSPRRSRGAVERRRGPLGREGRPFTHTRMYRHTPNSI